MIQHDPAERIQHIHVDKAVEGWPYTREILRRAAGMGIAITSGGPPAPPAGTPSREEFSAGKRVLLLTAHRGRFLKPCPATREYNCCGYHVLNTGGNCPMDCAYCILQAYLNTPWLTFHVNTSDLFAELRQAEARGRLLRIGTGEFTDSLALDRLTRLNEQLIPFFAQQRHLVLELKSKAVNVDHLLGLAHGNRTIMAWSLNSPAIARREEVRTAPLEQRLAAAARCAEHGYPLAFHFDPVVLHPQWREGYGQVIDKLFATVPAERIVWISLGALRFLPPLAPIARRRFQRTTIFDEEFIDGLDGKKRYFRTLRRELYQFLAQRLQERMDARTCLYFCMESDELWREVLGFIPAERGGLDRMLDEAAARAVQMT